MEAVEADIVAAVGGGELTVDRVRAEVRALSEGIAAKQTEIQLIVGSRYHELIESADSVVSMYRSCKRLGLVLQELPPRFETMVDARQPAKRLVPWREAAAAAAAEKAAAAGANNNKASFPLTRKQALAMLHAPTQVWAAMDGGRFLPAARLWLRAQRTAGAVEAAAAVEAEAGGVVVGGPMAEARAEVARAVLQEWAYLQELRPQLAAGARALLHDPDAPGGTAAHAGALAALCLLGSLNNTPNTSKSAGDKDTGKENVGPAALALLLESRTAWVLAAAAASGNDHDDDPSSNEQAAVVAAERVQRRLGRAARAIRETVLDVYRIFLSPSASGAGGGAVSVAMIGAEEEEDGEEAEGEVVGMLRAGLGKAQVREALTAWVAQHVQATHALATTLLRNLHSAAGLAAVRQSLWAETHNHNHHSKGTPDGTAAAGEWQEACHVGLALDRLRALLMKPAQPGAAPIPLALLPSPSSAGAAAGAAAAGSGSGDAGAITTGAGANAPWGGGLDLWGLLFTRSFAALVEDLLQDSMSALRGSLAAKVEATLAVLRSSSSTSNNDGGSTGSGSAGGGSIGIGRVTSVEMAWAAEHLVQGCLLEGLQQVAAQARGLVQEGDAAAAAALERSLRAQTHRLLAQVSAYLRGVVRVLGREEQQQQQQQQQPSSSSSSAAAAAAADPADLDGLLILARACLLLLHHAGSGGGSSSISNPLLRLGGAAANPAGQQPQKGGHKKGAGSMSASLEGKAGAGAGGGGGLRIDRVQLESAFTIADTRGVGELAPEELQEALDALGFNSSAKQQQAPQGNAAGGNGVEGFTSATFSELALLCSSMLVDGSGASTDDAGAFLREALEATFARAVGLWARHTVRPLGEALRHEAVIGLQTLNTPATTTDALWRAHQPGWEERVSLVQEDDDVGSGGGAGRTIEDRLWVPTAASPPVARFLLALAAALGRAARARDGFPSSSGPPSGASAGSPPSPSPPLLERLRAALVAAAREAVGNAYAPPHLQPARMGESAVLQMLLDVTLLRRWLGPEAGGASASAASQSWLARPREALLGTVDPINYEAVEPFLHEAARAYTRQCALLVAHLCREQGGGGALLLGASGGGGGGGGGGLSLSRSAADASVSVSASQLQQQQQSARALPLVPPVPRFTLLPVVVEATTPASTRLSPHGHRAAAGVAGATEGGMGPAAAGAVGSGGKGGGGFFSFTDFLPVGQGGVGEEGSPVAGSASAAASSAAAAVGSAASTVISSIFGGASQAGGVASSFLRR